MKWALSIRNARRTEWATAFWFVFQNSPENERADRVLHAIDMVCSEELQQDGIWVAVEAEVVKGAMITLRVPGASALVWPPQSEPGLESTVIQDLLLFHCCKWLRAQGIRVAQCLLEEKDQPLAEPLLRNGFFKATSLQYMRHDLIRAPARPGDPLRYQNYREADPDLFRATLEQTYQATLDCPELNGVRTMQEIISGHASQGKHDPDRWWLAFAQDVPVAILLLTEIPEWDSWDLSYLGVVAAARRQGYARNLAHKAIWETRQAGQRKLTLSVDRRNLPALALYQQLGFVAYDRREVYLSLWPADPNGSAVR